MFEVFAKKTVVDLSTLHLEELNRYSRVICTPRRPIPQKLKALEIVNGNLTCF